MNAAFLFRFEDVEVVVATVVDFSSWVLLQVGLLALGEVPGQSQGGHLVLGVKRTCDVRVIKASHLPN